MSLSKQMIIFITLLLMIVLAGTFSLTIYSTTNFLEQQLQSNARDTATSLSLSLGPVADPDDHSSMDTMINAVFDRGEYLAIELKDIDNNNVYVRERPALVKGVPIWFASFMSLKSQPETETVQSGWIRFGTLSVHSHPGPAYIELWNNSLKVLIWFILATAFSILLMFYILKTILKPLKKLERQAEAIVLKEYLIQKDIPKTTELKQVVIGMNNMVKKLKTIFDRDAKIATRFQKIAYQDATTGMSNRHHFDMVIDSLLDQQLETSAGELCLIRIDKFKELNEQCGYLAADKALQSIAKNLKKFMNSPNTLYARLNGTELIAVLPGAMSNNTYTNACKLAESFNQILIDLNASHTPTFISVATIPYQPGDKRGSLLAKLDYAIGESLKLGRNKAFGSEAQSVKQNKATWINVIDSALQDNRFKLFYQMAYSKDNEIQSKEILIRLREKDNTIRSAGYFMPAAEKLNKVIDIEKYVISQAIEYIERNPLSEMLAINLSDSLLNDPKMLDWIIDKTKNIAKNAVAFEITERWILSMDQDGINTFKQFKKTGYPIGLDNFGAQFGDLKYLQEVKPSYIKLDVSFSKSIESNNQTQSYISSLCEMAASLDIDVIAMAIENETQLNIFKSLGVRYFQGFHFGAPSPFE